MENNIKLIIRTTEGKRHRDPSKTIETKSVKEMVDFFRRNCTTGGYSINYFSNGSEVIEVVKKGRLIQKDIKDLVNSGYTIGFYSWAWAPKTFEINGKRMGIAKTINGVTMSDALSYKGLLY